MDREDTIKAYKRLFESKDGETVLKDLVLQCHALSGTYNESPHAMSYKEGERSVFFHILNTIDLDLDKFRKLNAEVQDTEWAQ